MGYKSLGFRSLYVPSQIKLIIKKSILIAGISVRTKPGGSFFLRGQLNEDFGTYTLVVQRV